MERAQGLDTDSEEELEKLRELTAELDQRVHPLIRSIVEAGKCPIVIGGGHNNSYGNLRGAYEALRNRKVLDEQAGMACLNIDPHADLRLAEGRHSGNGFTYACDEGYLEYYGIFGLHRNYNPEGILERFDSAPSNFFPTYFDRMLEAGEQDAALLELLGKLEKKERPIGMEIDLDSVAGMAVSAQTPSGFHENDIRRSLLKVLQRKPIAYLHLAEGAPGNKPGYEEHVGKFLAFLVSDAIRNASDPV
jgi:formiminoglutamase